MRLSWAGLCSRRARLRRCARSTSYRGAASGGRRRFNDVSFASWLLAAGAGVHQSSPLFQLPSLQAGEGWGHAYKPDKRGAGSEVHTEVTILVHTRREQVVGPAGGGSKWRRGEEQTMASTRRQIHPSFMIFLAACAAGLFRLSYGNQAAAAAGDALQAGGALPPHAARAYRVVNFFVFLPPPLFWSRPRLAAGARRLAPPPPYSSSSSSSSRLVCNAPPCEHYSLIVAEDEGHLDVVRYPLARGTEEHLLQSGLQVQVKHQNHTLALTCSMRRRAGASAGFRDVEPQGTQTAAETTRLVVGGHEDHVRADRDGVGADHLPDGVGVVAELHNVQAVLRGRWIRAKARGVTGEEGGW